MKDTGRLALVHCGWKHERFAWAKFFANQRQAEDAALETVGKAREERRFLFIFGEIELAHDEVAFFAGVNQFAERWLTAAHAAFRANGFGIHPGDKQRIVSDVLAQRAFRI